MNLRCLRLITALWLALGLCLQQAWAQPSAATFDAYARLLERHVVEYDLESDGLISAFDYRSAMADTTSLALVAQQRDQLAELDTAPSESREAALAFWINAYNFFMIAHIVDHPDNGAPVDSVKDFGGFFSPYRVFGRRIFEVAGDRRSLDEMEKEILLGESFAERGWKDARVHFAVNCASVGCPPLRDRPYTPSNVDELLDDNTRRALRTPLHLAIEGDTARLSRLFDWYQADFEEASGSVDAFIEAHLDRSRRRAFESADSRRFIEYDWSLNSMENIQRWLEARPSGR